MKLNMLNPFTRLNRSPHPSLRYAATALIATSALVTSHSYADYSKHPEFKKFLNEVVTEKVYPKDKLIALAQQAERKDSILEAISRPAEKTFTWGRYRNIFLKQERIDKGVEFYKLHKATFDKASQETGVPASILLAILGVETRYGQHKGNYRVIDALATLGFDYPPRGKFFRKQLKAFLKLEDEAHIDLNSATGSYAGAMGYPQFIPSSYRHYAVDFDNDNVIDLINNPVDAIGSVANYFKEHGWKTGEPITFQAKRKPDSPKLDGVLNDSLKPKHRLKDINAMGLTTTTPLDVNQKVTAMRMENTDATEYWIGLKNFYVITRYNHSRLYAMAVFQLSQALEERLNDAI